MATIILAFISVIILVSLHELGHFLTAKKFGLKAVFLNLKSEPKGEADLQINAFKQLAEKIPELKSL